MSDVGYYDQSYPPSLWTPTPPPLPTVTSVTPNTGVAGTTASLTIVGTGFTAESVVRFDGTALVTTFVDPTNLTAPSGVLPAAGTYQVTVRNGVTDISNGVPFTVTAAVEEEPQEAPTEAPEAP